MTDDKSTGAISQRDLINPIKSRGATWKSRAHQETPPWNMYLARHRYVCRSAPYNLVMIALRRIISVYYAYFHIDEEWFYLACQ